MKLLKTRFPKSVLILLFAFLLTNCSIDDDTNNSVETDYNLSAKVDGEDFSRDFVTVSTLAGETDFYTISAVGESTSIGLTLESPISTGTFTASTTTVMFYQQNNPFIVWGANEDAGSGTITIIENTDTYVKGTFSFTGVNPADNSTKQITEGTFTAEKL